MEYRIIVSKQTPDGYRTFIQDADGKPVSPLMPDLAALFPWMNRNGWVLAESMTTDVGECFSPWRVERVV